MNLASIFKKYLSETKTGQLVIKFEEENYLCKVHIQNGNALYISIGRKNPDETMTYIAGRKPVDANFIDGISPVKKLNEPLNSKLLILAGAGNGDSGISTNLNVDVRDR